MKLLCKIVGHKFTQVVSLIDDMLGNSEERRYANCLRCGESNPYLNQEHKISSLDTNVKKSYAQESVKRLQGSLDEFFRDKRTL